MNKYLFFFLCFILAVFSAAFIYQIAVAIHAAFKIWMLEIEERRILKRMDKGAKQKKPNYISDETISEKQGTVIEIPGKLSAAQISRTKEALTNFASDGITAKQFLENARIFASGGITAKDAMQNFTENLSRANLVSIREINDGLYIRLFGVGKGKTIADAAELVGNYGQPMTFIEEARRIAKEFNIGPNIAGEIANIAQQNKIPLRFLMPPDFKK